MSHSDSGSTGATCDNCDRTFGNAGAAARHEQACEGEADSDPKMAEGDAIMPADVELRDLRHVSANMREADLRKSLEAMDFTPADGDTLRTAFAKAHVDAKGGGKSRYVGAFDRCDADGCEYGRNGYEATHCKRHEGEGSDADESASEPEPEPAKGDEKPPEGDDFSRAEYEASLVAAGLTPTEAAEAGEERFR